MTDASDTWKAEQRIGQGVHVTEVPRHGELKQPILSRTSSSVSKSLVLVSFCRLAKDPVHYYGREKKEYHMKINIRWKLVKITRKRCFEVSKKSHENMGC